MPLQVGDWLMLDQYFIPVDNIAFFSIDGAGLSGGTWRVNVHLKQQNVTPPYRGGFTSKLEAQTWIQGIFGALREVADDPGT